DIEAVSWLSVADPQRDPLTWRMWQKLTISPRLVRIHSQSSFPIQNDYQTPHTLGTDRIVGVIAAQRRAPQRSVLVIDAGTALTYDFAKQDGSYLGGGIAPGLSMRFRSLHEFTARLPWIESPEQAPPLIGVSTQSSIESGVFNGMCAEIEGVVARYQREYDPQVQVFLSGGDFYRFENQLRCINFADSNLILYGIYHLASDPNFA
ncbi:MAG: type III pantothenate kinase, partial [Bacteroidota bacterium]